MIAEQSILPDAFEPSGLGATIFRERYARDAEETWDEACRRVADHVAQAETNGNVRRFSERFYDQLRRGLFSPGGRIWYGSGRSKAQLLNCVSGDTEVHTQSGLVPAGELVGQTVQVLSEGGEYRPASWYSYGRQQLYRVVLDNGDELRATEAHEWVVMSPTGQKRVTTAELVGRRIPLQAVARFEYDEEEWSTGVRHGLTYGDGYCYMDGRYAQLRQFGDSRPLVPRFFDTYTEYAKIEALVVNRLPGAYKRLPTGAESPSYIRGFVAGFIAADGHVDRRGSVGVFQSRYDELVAVRRLAASVGLPSSRIYLFRERNPWTGADAPLWRLSFTKAGFYRDGRPDEHLVLKAEHLANIAGSPLPKKTPTVEVVAVVPDAEEEVFCCVEPETHTMVIGPGYLTGQCFVVPTSDSREGWGKSTSDVIVISGLMGGVGLNLSPVRPRGYQVKGTGGVATGAVSLGQLINDVGNVIVGGGGRRMALMLCLDVNHPDVEEFLHSKLDLQQLNNANISVVLPPDLPADEFVARVRAGEEIELVFNGVPSGKTVNATWLWEKLVENSWKNGEPGVLNGHLANKMSNIWYYKPLVSTNPCGEIWLEEYGCCCLGSLVLPRFVRDGAVDWDLLDEAVRLGVRFLDDVLTVNHYPLPEIKEDCEAVRRIGLGVMGLHTMLLELGMRYDDEESFRFVDRLFAFIKNTAYDASISLAIEKGPFPAYDQRFLDSGFAKTLKRGIRNKVREHGIRNCAVLTVPPTGTTSMMYTSLSGVRLSSACEPHAPAVYWRNFYRPTDDGTRKLDRELVVEDVYHRFPELAQSAVDVSVEGHFRMQATIQRHVDNAVSKTINMAQDFPQDAFGDVWLRYLPQLKGTTVYRFGSRENEPINPVPRDQWEAVIAEHRGGVGEMTVEEFMAVDCPGGSCEVQYKKWAPEEESVVTS